MIYWVIYDISSTRIRSKVASKCKDYGFWRVQKSVFVGETDRNRAQMLNEEISDLIDKDDCVFIFPACKECFYGKMIKGVFDEEAIRDKEFVIV